MRVMMYLPQLMRSKCFSDADFARLHKHFDVAVAPDVCESTDAESAWVAAVSGAQGVITGWNSPVITPWMLDAAPELELIVHAAGSVKHLLPPSIWERGIRVATCNEALAVGVAETTVGMMVAGLKGFFPANALTHAGGWKTNDTDCQGFLVRELYDVTIGLIGIGQVGRHVIRLLRSYEVTVIVADPHLTHAEAAALGVERVPLDALMRQCDVVSLHAPVLPSTRHMLGRAQFRAMKDGSIFINTARGSLVDETALAAELQTGRIFAFIDVTEPEPPARDHPFRQLPNVVLTPHIAGAISNGCCRLGRSAVDQLLRYTRGLELPGEVTADRIAIIA
jgi:phosphoglycerate dehydrogenase-like enzyme